MRFIFSFIIAILFSVPAFSDVICDTAGHGTVVQSASASPSIASMEVDSASNSVLITFVGNFNALPPDDVDTVAWNTSESLTSITTAQDSNPIIMIEAWYLSNPTVTTANVDGSRETTPAGLVTMSAIQCSGVDTSSPIKAFSSANHSDGGAGCSVTGLSFASGDMVLGMYMVRSTDPPGATPDVTASTGTLYDNNLQSGGARYTFSAATNSASGGIVFAEGTTDNDYGACIAVVLAQADAAAPLSHYYRGQ